MLGNDSKKTYEIQKTKSESKRGLIVIINLKENNISNEIIDKTITEISPKYKYEGKEYKLEVNQTDSIDKYRDNNFVDPVYKICYNNNETDSNTLINTYNSIKKVINNTDILNISTQGTKIDNIVLTKLMKFFD